MTVALNQSDPVYTGTGLNVSCNVKLDPNVNNNEEVSIHWNVVESGGQYSSTPAIRKDNNTYISNLTINPVADSDDGKIFNCTVTVTGGTAVQSATSSKSVTLNVTGRFMR